MNEEKNTQKENNEDFSVEILDKETMEKYDWILESGDPSDLEEETRN